MSEDPKHRVTRRFEPKEGVNIDIGSGVKHTNLEDEMNSDASFAEFQERMDHATHLIEKGEHWEAELLIRESVERRNQR